MSSNLIALEIFLKYSMTLYLSHYTSLLVYFLISCVLSIVFFVLSYIVAIQNGGTEKLSAYECGFEPFGDSRMKFDVRFYLVSILFIIFDLEVAFLFPWAITLGKIGALGFWSMMIFLGTLTVGFIYEWKKGALDWE